MRLKILIVLCDTFVSVFEISRRILQPHGFHDMHMDTTGEFFAHANHIPSDR